MKIISVGTNHAGTSFLRTLAKLNKDKKFEIVTYDRNDNISFLGCGIALWVGGEFKQPDCLFYATPEKLKESGVTVNMSHDVIEINHKEKYVMVKNLKTGETFKDKYDKLVFAGGTWPIVPPFEGMDLKNIYLSKLFQHAQEIHKAANDPKVKEVVVVGAGYIGIELVEAFHKHGKKVTLIDMETRVIPRYFDKDFTDRLEERMVKEGITLKMGEKIKGFKGKDGKVSTVVTNKGQYNADMVILSIGFKPLTDMLDGDKMPNGALIVDKEQRTSIKDVYAIGDSAAMIHNSLQKHMHVALATNAVKTGIVAAFSVAGSPLPFDGVTGTNAINVFGVYYSSTGFTEACAKNFGLEAATSTIFDNDRPEFMNNAEEVGFKIVYDPKTLRILGAQIGSWGQHSHTEVMYAMSLAIQKQMTLPEIALMDVYFLPHYNKPFNFMLQAILNALGMDYSK